MQPCYGEDKYISLVDVNFRSINALILDTTENVVKIQKPNDVKVYDIPKNILSEESLKLVCAWESSKLMEQQTKLTERWEYKSVIDNVLVSCSLPKGVFSATGSRYTINITLLENPDPSIQNVILSISVSSLLYDRLISDRYKSPESFKADWMKTRETEMKGMPEDQLEKYKNEFEKYRFDPVKVGDFKGFIYGSIDESNSRKIFLTTGEKFLTGILRNFEGGPMTPELALKIMSSVKVKSL